MTTTGISEPVASYSIQALNIVALGKLAGYGVSLKSKQITNQKMNSNQTRSQIDMNNLEETTKETSTLLGEE